MKILVADDSKTNLVIITDALTRLGHTVVPASSGKEAIEIFKHDRPDLVILDVVMEGMDGFECAKNIRAINIDDWIPIIFLSANVDDESISKGIDAGGDDYLTKPFSEITLAAKIKSMQRISDMRQKLYDTSQQLYLLSSTDVLTGIYNRLQFDRSIKEVVSAANRYQHLLALLYIDLDNFKNINDTFGHHIGDLLLKEVATRLKSCIRSADFIARLGGDEFAIILSEIKNPEEAGSVAQKIINELAFDYELDNHNIRTSASIGIAFYPLSASTHEDLMLNADIAMYHAKSLRRNNYQYFTEELSEKYKQQINLEHALKFAIERNELVLSYQPIFDIRTKELFGFETLVSWEHPKFGLISPNIFIPLAEETGLMPYIGSWILRKACEQYVECQLDKLKKIKFAVNVSSRQLNHEDFIDEIVDILKVTKVSPDRLELELTESTVMTYTSATLKTIIDKITDIGISIAIDDFGTGYSSLMRLKHLPISTLKIEKSFVQESIVSPNVAIIVNCLIALGNNLGMNVIAEGIETKEQLDFLVDKGCILGQGYFLSRPLTADKLINFIHEYTKTTYKI